jgi:isoleucyl-tRNA synthetase
MVQKLIKTSVDGYFFVVNLYNDGFIVITSRFYFKNGNTQYIWESANTKSQEECPLSLWQVTSILTKHIKTPNELVVEDVFLSFLSFNKRMSFDSFNPNQAIIKIKDYCNEVLTNLEERLAQMRHEFKLELIMKQTQETILEELPSELIYQQPR